MERLRHTDELVMAYFYFSVAVLAALLFFPASKMIWVMSVRRLQRKLSRELEPQEIEGQKVRARIIALLVVLVFSWLFNIQLLGNPHG